MSARHRVGRFDELAEATANRIEVDGRALCIVRLGDEVFAIDDRCSHEDYSLSEGEVDTVECAVECWKHGSLFSLRSGEPITFPATRPVATHAVSVEDGEVVVTLSDDATSGAER